ncbi:hypothetical protein [Paenibacillus sp. HW567]|uniref:hypothetical protein n=1 Tax=Paenibacillus sp. HW567 TaxID=1034769 RepID=UPI00037D0B51|nr:hypothetical protein [Paenibacillus sp. HW567]
MTNHITKIIVAAILLGSAPTASFAESAAGGVPTTAPDKAFHTKTEHHHPAGKERGFRAGGYFILNETSNLLDMDRAEIVRSLKSGKTLYTLAREKKGWSEEQYLQKLSEAASPRLEEAIKDGRLTKAEANKLKEGLPALLKLNISHAGQFHESRASEKSAKNR